jgi:putative hydrolases of HD superfamily
VKPNIASYLYELGQLKRVKRSGWWIAGIKDPESVAEHSFRAAVIAYLLAHLEDVDAEKAAVMALFHDAAESRINDLHRISRRYLNGKNLDRKVARDQTERLPSELAARINSLFSGIEEGTSPEAKVARDADILECLVQAREYEALGYRDVGDWIRNAKGALQTGSAKRIAEECVKTEPSAWWQGLKI